MVTFQKILRNKLEQKKKTLEVLMEYTEAIIKILEEVAKIAGKNQREKNKFL